MERNHLKYWDPHHIQTWVPTLTPAHLRTYPTLCLYPGDREGQYGVQNCQRLAGTVKCVQLMLRIPISQVQPMVPWTVRPNYWPNYCLSRKDPDVTALYEAVKEKLGITQPLPKPALASPPPGLNTLADDLNRSRVSRLLPEVTCPSPFHPRSRTVPIAELQDVPVTEAEKKGLTAWPSLAGVPSLPSGLSPGGGKSGKPNAQANIQLQLPEFNPKNCPNWQRNLPSFFCLPANLMWMWPLNVLS